MAARSGQTLSDVEETVADEPAPTVYYNLGFPFTAGSDFQINEEVITAEDPDWIIIPEGGEVPDTPGLQESTAVENDQIIEVNSNFISQHGPRNVQVLQQFAETFQEETPTESMTPTEMATATETEDADDSGPGFGVAAVAMAVALAALFARRNE